MSKPFLAAIKYCAVLQNGHESDIAVDCVETRTDDPR
jgi:hypothetical protein